jgi:Tat protein translocase TatB subunit
MPSSLGPAEILVIVIVALIVLGPAKLPQAGRQVGKTLSEIRRFTSDMRSEVKQAFDAEAESQARPGTAPPSYTDYQPLPSDGPPVTEPEPSPPAPTPEPPAQAHEGAERAQDSGAPAVAPDPTTDDGPRP